MDTLQALIDLIPFKDTIKDNLILSAIFATLSSGAIGTGILSFLRRPKPARQKLTAYFEDSSLLTPPTKRPAYSDRMAYVMAEMSDLAYFEFEGSGGAIIDAVDRIQRLNMKNIDEVQTFLESFTEGLMSNRALNIGFLTKILQASNFELIDTIDVAETQGFACKYTGTEETPYVVIAFRGTEKKISDWLTDIKAIPTTFGEGKVHTGFYEAFTKEKDKKGRTVADRVMQIMQSAAVRDDKDETLPLFITGHSLGGALALMATNLLAADIKGACYTFGGPRIANYEYFDKLKTPVYRIVNSSDIVPRVPPGASMAVIVNIVKLLSWVSKIVPVVSQGLDKVETFLDKLNGYRHVGDLRYLTDVAANQFHQVRVLSNPPVIDRIMWMWQHLASSLFFPVSSHSMSVYRRKLLHIAGARNIGLSPQQNTQGSSLPEGFTAAQKNAS